MPRLRSNAVSTARPRAAIADVAVAADAILGLQHPRVTHASAHTSNEHHYSTRARRTATTPHRPEPIPRSLQSAAYPATSRLLRKRRKLAHTEASVSPPRRHARLRTAATHADREVRRPNSTQPPPPELRLWDEMSHKQVKGFFDIPAAVYRMTGDIDLELYVGQDDPNFPESIFSFIPKTDIELWRAELDKNPLRRRVMLIDPRRGKLIRFSESPDLYSLEAYLQERADRVPPGKFIRVFNSVYTIPLGLAKQVRSKLQTTGLHVADSSASPSTSRQPQGSTSSHARPRTPSSSQRARYEQSARAFHGPDDPSDSKGSPRPYSESEAVQHEPKCHQTPQEFLCQASVLQKRLWCDVFGDSDVEMEDDISKCDDAPPDRMLIDDATTGKQNPSGSAAGVVSHAFTWRKVDTVPSSSSGSLFEALRALPEVQSSDMQDSHIGGIRTGHDSGQGGEQDTNAEESQNARDSQAAKAVGTLMESSHVVDTTQTEQILVRNSSLAQTSAAPCTESIGVLAGSDRVRKEQRSSVHPPLECDDTRKMAVVQSKTLAVEGIISSVGELVPDRQATPTEGECNSEVFPSPKKAPEENVGVQAKEKSSQREELVEEPNKAPQYETTSLKHALPADCNHAAGVELKNEAGRPANPQTISQEVPAVNGMEIDEEILDKGGILENGHPEIVQLHAEAVEAQKQSTEMVDQELPGFQRTPDPSDHEKGRSLLCIPQPPESNNHECVVTPIPPDREDAEVVGIEKQTTEKGDKEETDAQSTFEPPQEGGILAPARILHPTDSEVRQRAITDVDPTPQQMAPKLSNPTLSTEIPAVDNDVLAITRNIGDAVSPPEVVNESNNGAMSAPVAPLSANLRNGEAPVTAGVEKSIRLALTQFVDKVIENCPEGTPPSPSGQGPTPPNGESCVVREKDPVQREADPEDLQCEQPSSSVPHARIPKRTLGSSFDAAAHASCSSSESEGEDDSTTDCGFEQSDDGDPSDPLWKPKRRVFNILRDSREAGPKILKRELAQDLRQDTREKLLLEVQSVNDLLAFLDSIDVSAIVQTAERLCGQLEMLDVHGCFTDDLDISYGPPNLQTLREELLRGRVCTTVDVAKRFEEMCSELVVYYGESWLGEEAQYVRQNGVRLIQVFMNEHEDLVTAELKLHRVGTICERGLKIGFLKPVSRRRSAAAQLKASKQGSLHVSGCQPEVTFLNYRDEKGHSVMGKQQSVRVFGMAIDLLACEESIGNIKRCHICEKEKRLSIGDVLSCANQMFNICDEIVCEGCVKAVCGIERNDFTKLRERGDWLCVHCRGLCPLGSPCLRRVPELPGNEQQSRSYFVKWLNSGAGVTSVAIEATKRLRCGQYEQSSKRVNFKRTTTGVWCASVVLAVGSYRCKIIEDKAWVASSSLQVFPETSRDMNSDAGSGNDPHQVIGKSWMARTKDLGPRRIVWEESPVCFSGAVHAVSDSEGGRLIQQCSRTEGYDWRRAKRHSIAQWIPKRQGVVPTPARCETLEFLAYETPQEEEIEEVPPALTPGTPYETFFVAYNSFLFRKMRRTQWGIVTGRSEIHGIGLFTLTGYARDDMVIEYAGDLIRTPLGDVREREYEAAGLGTYLFKLNEEQIVDATVKSNRARFTNHSCDPNMRADIVHIEGRDLVVLRATRSIPKFAELTFDYKLPYEDKKLQCLCNASNCVGVLN